jgi:predicted Fe-Mo cluster-binding NifX family protein
MKIAITSTGNTLEATLDQRFGRCKYFVIYDTENKSFEFIPNPNLDAEEGAGPASVELVAERQVKKIVSSEFGVKIKSLLDSLKIQMIVLKDPGMTIRDIIEMLNHKKE